MSADAQTGRWQGGMIAGRRQLPTPSGCGCMQGEIEMIHPVRMEYVYYTCTRMYLVVHGPTCTYMRAGSAHVHPFNHNVSNLKGARIVVKIFQKNRNT